jgi:MoxR-like ATPase
MKNTLTNENIASIHQAMDLTKAPVKKAAIIDVAESLGLDRSLVHKTVRTMFSKASKRGYYTFPVSEVTGEFLTADTPVSTPAVRTPAENFKLATTVASVVDDEIHIPTVDSTYVKWGEFKTVADILAAGIFYPLYIEGMSGNGKTFMVEQACAKAKREYIRVQISPETDEDDLIGGFRLINGETIYQKGPVVKAMERGAVLLVDEIDRSTNKIMCLQGVLEGNPVLLKKTGEVITPARGFTVIATANTKGRGSDDGRYTAASIIDDAFLERFVATIEQEYPAARIEKKILVKHAEKYEVSDLEFIDKLVAWSNVIRKTFEDEAVDEVISTRRLCHIVKSHSIFANRMKSIEMCINRFDSETKDAFLDLYTKIDESANLEEFIQEGETVENGGYDPKIDMP